MSKCTKYGAFNLWDGAKILALGLMVIDHIGYFFFPDIPVFRALGRGAIPLFLFLIGFAPHHRFSYPLLAIALVMGGYNYVLGGQLFPLNILFAILLVRLWLRYTHVPGTAYPAGAAPVLTLKRPLEWYIVIQLFLLPTGFLWQGGAYVFLFALIGLMARHAKRYKQRIRAWFSGLVFATYTLLEQLAFEFVWTDFCVLLATMGGCLYVFWLLEQWAEGKRDIALVHPIIDTVGRFLGRYTLYLYALHVLLFQLLTGKPM